MIKLPIIVLSYGEFSKTKKLFGYDDDDIFIMPIFTDIDHAFRFAKFMNSILDVENDRNLLIQICTNKQYAIDLFTIISVAIPNFKTIAINPTIIDGKIINETVINISDIIQQFHSELEESGSEPEAPESEPEAPESKV